MPIKLRNRLTYANVVSTLCLFVVLGGSAYAAVTITGKNVKNSSLTGRDVKNESLTGKDVRRLGTKDVSDGALLAADFKPGQLPSGAQGARGLKGDKGDPGPLLETLPSGRTLRGVFATRDTDTGLSATAYDSISFTVPLAVAPAAHYQVNDASATAECPGSNLSPQAAPGHLCVYETVAASSIRGVFNPLTGIGPGSSRYGAVVVNSATSAAFSYGTWAVTAP